MRIPEEHEPDTGAVERYLADVAAADEDDSATFARCDAVVALVPKIGRMPDVAWVFDEARWIARGRPGAMRRPTPTPWYLSPGLAWGVAAALALALVVSSLPPLLRDDTMEGPAADESAATAPPQQVANITFAPIVISTELAQALAEIAPVVLLANETAVDARSLAVLPFVENPNGASSRDAAAMADSIYAQVFRQLSSVPGIIVIDAATASIYAGSDLPPEEIARQLGVRGIVEGSVASLNDEIRFELRLTDAASAGSSIDEAIERPTDELALLQRDIASSVIDALARTRSPIPPNDIL